VSTVPEAPPESAARPTGRRRLRTLLAIPVVGAGLGLVAWRAIEQMDRVAEMGLQLDPSILAAVPFVAIGHVAASILTIIALRALGGRAPAVAVLSITLMAQASKYLPGGSVANVSTQMIGLSRFSGLGKRRSLLAVSAAQLTLLLGAFAWFGITSLATGVTDVRAAACLVPPIALVAIAFVSHLASREAIASAASPERETTEPGSSRLHRLIRMVGGSDVMHVLATQRWTVTTGYVALMIGVGTLGWVSYGASLSVMTATLTPVDTPLALTLSGAMAIGWAAGIASIVAPAGLGVREATLSIMLGGALGEPLAVLVTVLSRLVWIAGDLAVVGIGALLMRTSWLARMGGRPAHPSGPTGDGGGNGA
jgi:hypothetical protein